MNKSIPPKASIIGILTNAIIMIPLLFNIFLIFILQSYVIGSFLGYAFILVYISFLGLLFIKSINLIPWVNVIISLTAQLYLFIHLNGYFGSDLVSYTGFGAGLGETIAAKVLIIVIPVFILISTIGIKIRTQKGLFKILTWIPFLLSILLIFGATIY